MHRLRQIPLTPLPGLESHCREDEIDQAHRLTGKMMLSFFRQIVLQNNLNNMVHVESGTVRALTYQRELTQRRNSSVEGEGVADHGVERATEGGGTIPDRFVWERIGMQKSKKMEQFQGVGIDLTNLLKG